MQKALPQQTADVLNPPANVRTPYTFFENVGTNPLQPLDTALNLRNAWWFADAALLAYSSESAIRDAFANAGITGEVHYFRSSLSTQGYLISMPVAIVLAFRGTQVDSFWPSILDFSVNARFLPRADSHGNLVHSGFLAAFRDVWPEAEERLRAEQARRPRPLWITGHSLGGALATVAANVCSDDPNLHLAGAYTYGCPKVGDNGFCDRIRAPLYRFRNDSDLVPHVPIGLVVAHAGELQFIDAEGHLHDEAPSTLNRLLSPQRDLPSISDMETLKHELRAGGANLPVPPFLADHAPINYSILVWNRYEATAG